MALSASFGCGGFDDNDPVATTGRIAFVSAKGQSGSSAIVVMRSDGSRRRQLTHPRSPHDGVGGIDWAPNGRAIAYSASLAGWNDDAYSDLFVINADGSRQRRLTRTYEDDWLPNWSPDGRTLAFDRNDDGYNWVYTTAAGGGDVHRLTPNFSWHPDWSPDGRLAFLDRRGIWVMNADGSQKRLLTKVAGTVPGDAAAPSWSPDGKSIAFTTGTALWVMRSDGTKRRRLFNDPDRATGFPVWSPDGHTIAFTQGDGDREVFVVNIDGSGLRNLSDNKRIQDGAPDWSPDGRAIAFMTDRDGAGEIYVMNADGTGLRNLTDSPHDDCCPAWSP